MNGYPYCLQVMKAYPKGEDLKKRVKRPAQETNIPTSKKPRTEEVVITDSPVDITEAFITERLTPELAANLVIMGMVIYNFFVIIIKTVLFFFFYYVLFFFQNRLPDVMPPLFSATYTPIAAAGTQGQIKHVARLLATQLNAVGLGPGASIVGQQKIVPVRSSHICIFII
jgi:symplekin